MRTISASRSCSRGQNLPENMAKFNMSIRLSLSTCYEHFSKTNENTKKSQSQIDINIISIQKCKLFYRKVPRLLENSLKLRFLTLIKNAWSSSKQDFIAKSSSFSTIATSGYSLKLLFPLWIFSMCVITPIRRNYGFENQVHAQANSSFFTPTWRWRPLTVIDWKLKKIESGTGLYKNCYFDFRLFGFPVHGLRFRGLFWAFFSLRSSL